MLERKWLTLGRIRGNRRDHIFEVGNEIMATSDSHATHYDVLGIGNAIVDLIATAQDDFLVREAIQKGGMTLIDEPRAEHIYKEMGPATITSGGSAGNTMAGIASFGGKGAYIGKVRNDELGRHFSHDIKAIGVDFSTMPATSGPATARCMILVTPDGERSMNTYLGACQNLTPDDVDAKAVKSATVTYLEGYLWDPPAAKDAFRTASKIAHEGGRKVALTLSDSFCVDRYRAEFLDLMRSGQVDIVFANESELKSLYSSSDFDTAVEQVRKDVGLAVVTRSENGAMAISGQETVIVPAYPVAKVVDTTGAGDLFAAGFLFGYTTGKDMRTSLSLGALAAAEVISHVGPRPLVSLKQLAIDNGLI
jgi:sugar/nucleoside kinase (ribokinase family)